ncbi:MAG: DNA polymerase III subunit gamma/tau [Isosphaeraceae bacterium]
MDPESNERSQTGAAIDTTTLPRGPQAPYTVVARRYRPQRFEDVVGQDHVVRALRNAIRLNRIAQAYLFCGTRGVGKTSMARIFAKCLNCVKGPTEEPCQTCDICQAIASGQDVDVIEIDGASNNGVEQVRELRQNAALRPSRSRFKIYYIDEVHMLTTGAFNALLKTLEEPPPHVKFFFATTEPGKIPITVLSRCQRYDFAGITPEVIAASLSEICLREQVDAEPEALQVVARRAGGSLRDAQSLLDRLLASGAERLSAEVVHGLLGTASDERLLDLLAALADHDSAAALSLVEQGMTEGVQPAEILSGLIEFVRDAMVMATGAESMLLAVTPRQRPRLKKIVERWTLESILAALQVLGEARARMRGSVHGRLLVELALCRVAQLENLTAVSTIVERLAALESGSPLTSRPDGGSPVRRPVPAEPLAAPPKPPSPRGELTGDSAGSAPVLAAGVATDQIAQPEGAALPKATGKRAGGARALDSGAPAASTAVVVEPAAAAAPAVRSGEKRRSTSARTPATSGGVTPRSPAQEQRDSPAASSSPATGDSTSPASATAAAAESQPVNLAPLDLAKAREVWPDLIKKVGANLGWRLSQVEPVAALGSDVLVIAAKPGYNSMAEVCGTPDALVKIGQGLQRLLHRPVSVRYERSPDNGESAADARPSELSRAESVIADPMVQKVVELFEARPYRTDVNDSAESSQS